MDDPLPCANGCGFFRTDSSRNLCSKCYRDFLKEELAKVASMEKPMNPSSVVDYSPMHISPTLLSSQNTVVSTTVTASKRCQSCKKRVGLLGFECRCGGVFCGVHRYAEKHSCSFNFKAVGRDALAKGNPVCESDKLKERI